MKMISKILSVLLLGTLLNAESDINISKEHFDKQLRDNNELITSIKDGYNKKIDEISKNSKIKNAKDEKTIESDITENYKKFKSVINSFDNNSLYEKEIDKFYKNKIDKLNDKDSITFIYFINEDTNYASIKNFVTEIDVLRSHYKNVNGKIFLNNYPENLEDTKDGDINAYMSKNEVIQTKYGSLNINRDGKYTYSVNKNQNLTAKAKLSDSITLNDISNTQHVIDIKLKANSKGEIKILDEFNPKGMYRYLKELKEYGISSKNVNFHVHPWAYKELGLEVVPAYLLTYCDNDDFRYKYCSNKYLIKGNISLQYFLTKVSEEDKYFNKFVHSLQEGKNAN